MPAINPGESRNSYIPRCVSYVMKHEGLEQKAAVGKCEGMYDQHLKNSKSKAATEEWANSFLNPPQTNDENEQKT